MPLVQVRDVPEETVAALRARADALGLTLTAFLRQEFNRLAARPTNAEIAARMAERDRSGAPTRHQTVEEIRRLRESS